MARLLAVFALLLGSIATPSAVEAKAIKILVGFPPGQATDLVARLLAQRLQVSFGEPVVVENRPGQGGSMALAQLARAEPDGATMGIRALAAFSANPHLYGSVNYDTLHDFAPASLVADLPMVLIVHPKVPAKTLAELIDYARANPGLKYSSSGIGTLSHLAMEHLKRAASVDIQHVPYRGSAPAINDLIGGRIDMAIDTLAVAMPQVEGGNARLLAVVTPGRLPALPETPTIAESGYPGFNASAWIGVVYPRGTQPAIVARTAAAIAGMMKDPETRTSLASLGAIPRTSTPKEFEDFLKSEYARWGDIIRSAGIKPE